MRHHKILCITVLAAAASFLAPSAHAQFAGDVFFAQPSVAVPEGGTGELEVLLFSGAQVLGAAHFDVVFDPSLAEVVAVEAGTTQQLAPGHVSVTTPGRAAVVDLNGVSLSSPIGTSSLARLTVRPLAPAGTLVPLSIQVRSLLRPDSSAMAGRGFAGEILVVSALQASSDLQSRTAPAVDGAEDDGELAARAEEMRRPGQPVELLDFRRENGEVSAVVRQVVVPAPAGEGDVLPSVREQE